MSHYFSLLVILAIASVLTISGCRTEPTFAYQELGSALIVDIPTAWVYGVDEGKRRLCGADKGSLDCQTLVMWAGLPQTGGGLKAQLEIHRFSVVGKYIEIAELLWKTLVSPQNIHNDRLVVHGYEAVFFTRMLLEDETHLSHLHIKADDAHWRIECSASPGPGQAATTNQCKDIVDSVRFSSAPSEMPLDSKASPELPVESESTIAYQEPGVPLTVNIPKSWEYGLARRHQLRDVCSRGDRYDRLCQAIVMWGGVTVGDDSVDLQFPQLTVLKVHESSHFRKFADFSVGMKSQVRRDLDESVRLGVVKSYELTDRVVDGHEALLLYEQRTFGAYQFHLLIQADNVQWWVFCSGLHDEDRAFKERECRNIIDSVRFSR